MTEAPRNPASSAEESEIIDALENTSDQETEENAEKLKKNVNTANELKESWRKLWSLRRDTFVERKGNKIYYKLDTVTNYLKEISTSNSKIRDCLYNDRETIVTAVQIALYKAGSEYLPVGLIDWLRWPITRWAVDKFQKANWLWGQKNPWYLNVKTINKLIEVATKKEGERNRPKQAPVKWEASAQKPENPSKKSETQKKQESQKKPENPKKPEASKKPKTPQMKAPTMSQIEAPKDNTSVAQRPIDKTRINHRLTIPDYIKESSEKQWWTLEQIWADVTKNVWYFKEWINGSGDYRFLFKQNPLPNEVRICGEKYKYAVDWDNLTWLWFQSYDQWFAFQLWMYVDWVFDEWARFYEDWVKEVWKFNFWWDLVKGTRIERDWSQHKVENWEDLN